MKIAIIRIKGRVKLDKDIVETFNRLRLKRKYNCIVIENPSPSQMGMIKKLRSFVAFGEINDETYKKLQEKRGGEKGKENVFRLHPPRGGAKTKEHFPKGVRGDNGKKINDLIERML
jgi:large subunit ribosomal protein L30